MNRVIVSSGLPEFFRQEVSKARTETGVEISDMAEYYLVNLLCDFSHTSTGPAAGEEPLALMYQRALSATPTERVQMLKELGDVALYVSGFFSESIERSAVDIDYYISMGGTAYNQVSGLFAQQSRGDDFSDLYTQLATKFTELVDVLNDISDRTMGDNSKDLLRMYDRWVRTGSERIHKKLVEQGLIPNDDLPTEYLQ